jgi:two-component system sensor histidine kinase UhpB
MIDLPDQLKEQVEQRTAELQATIAVLERHVRELAAEAAMLRTREERFHAFMDHLQGFAWIKNETGAYVYANRYFIETFGLAGAEVIGKTDAHLFPPGVADHFAENDRLVRRSNRALEVIETFPLADKVHYGLATKFPLRYGDTDSVMIAGMAFDITERIEREDLLKRQAHIIDEIRDGVISTNVDGRITSWNKGAERLFGYRAEEAAGQQLSLLLYPGEHHDSLTHLVWDALNRNGSHDVELPLVRKTGESFYAHLGLTLLHDEQGAVAGIIGYVRDITDRRNVEEALKSREAALKLALNAAHMGTWNWCLATDEVTYSSQVPSLYGCGGDDFGAYFDEFLRHVYPKDRPTVLAAFQHSISSRTAYEIEHRCVWPDDTVHWLIAKGEVIWEQDRPIRLTGTIMDVTQRKEAEIKLQHAHDQLRQLAKRLVDMEEEERARLSRELHDEFAQTLTGLSYSLVRLVKQLQERFEPTTIRDMQQDIGTMEGLVHKMIGSTRRIATGLRPSILDQLGLIAALRWLARDSETLLLIPCEMSIDDDLAQQPFDPTLSITIFRITQELLTNVARHAGASRVVVEAAYEAPCVILTVHDDGRGITEQEISNPVSLGLRGIRERVALLGGEIEIHGLPGEGTSVQARIPVGHQC